MILIGSDDGVYRVSRIDESPSPEATKTLDAGRVVRLRQFEGVSGVFAATESGLYRSLDGKQWTELDVPREKVYAVVASSADERLYAGTRPAHVYAADLVDDDGTAAVDAGWYELDEFQKLPSREEWQLPRHDDLAQVRDLCVDPVVSDRVVAGVEVGGVHVSDDGGETWSERSEGVHDDVHELHVVDASEYVAATGDGLYRTSDAGQTWKRLDREVPQSYFRRAFSTDGVVYASAALSNSSTWEDDDADPALFACYGDGLKPIEIPNEDETVTGMTAVDGDLVVATHRGSLFARRSDCWVEGGTFPVPGQVTGRYTPVTVYNE